MSKEKLTFREVADKMRAFNEENGYRTKGTKTKIYAVAVIKESSFDKPFTLEERSYKFSSDNKAFLPDQISNSIFSNCLDGKDTGVRLDWYLPTDWEVDYCYMTEE